MADKIGQILYNVEDYNTSGGFVSTAKIAEGSGILTTIKSSQYESWEAYKAACVDIFFQNDHSTSRNIVKTYFGADATFTKLGIQAPQGTKVHINEKEIVIGRTGVYEVDDEIVIDNLYFERPLNYILNVALTEQEKEQGIRDLQSAEEWRQAQLAAIEHWKTEDSQRYWELYTGIQKEFQSKYNDALSHFNKGINGVYQLPTQIDPTRPEDDNYKELYNVIIDFIH